MSKLFNSVAIRRPQKAKFDLSHERKFSFNMGKLVPILVQEILPGDKFRVNTEVMLRFAPMLAPIMHRVNVTTHYFFVPTRLLWDEWEPFITGGVDGLAQPIPPYATTQDLFDGNFLQPGDLTDFMGIPSVDPAAPNPLGESIPVSVLPMRAYLQIYNDYYRDQTLSPEQVFSKTGGQQTLASGQIPLYGTLLDRAWEKDYFTSALPFAQRGPSVDVPLAGEGQVVYKPTSDIFTFDGTPIPGTHGDLNTTTGAVGNLRITNAGAGGIDGRIENIDTIELMSSGVTINDLRRSVRLQEWLEKNALGGARYVEQNLVHFNVRSSDARLQRSEYLGGGRTPVVISEVLSTVTQVDVEPLGTMGGHGRSIGNQNGFNRFFEEHGYVIGIMSVLPKTAYQQGLPRLFSRFDKLEYAFPSFAHIGEQEILNKELFYDSLAQADPLLDPNATFGYQSRYSEYKYQCSSVHGDFKTNLAYWHMGRIFDAQPVLNAAFVQSDPTDRIFAAQEVATAKMWCHIYHNMSAIRPLPYFGTPTL